MSRVSELTTHNSFIFTGVIGESPPISASTIGRQGNRGGGCRYGNKRVAMTTGSRQCSSTLSGPSIAVSMRHAFVPFSGKTCAFLSYGQVTPAIYSTTATV